MNLKNNSGRSVKFLSSSFFYFRSYWSWGYQYLLFCREYRHYRHEYCDALRDLVPFVQFKEREKSPWRSVAFSKVVNTPSWVFFTFFKLCKWYQMAHSITRIMRQWREINRLSTTYKKLFDRNFDVFRNYNNTSFEFVELLLN